MKKLFYNCIKLLITSYIIFLILVVFYFFATDTGHYLFALALETRWSKAEPKTKQELEKIIFCYNIKTISPTQSLWGSKYKLNSDEKMIQYCIMWDEKCPLDVVVDTNNNIKAIFTSYE